MTAGAEVRKTVTVLFCDLTGSTALTERLDPESMRMVMSRFFAEMKAAIERHGGTVEKFIGDAVMAVFGIPLVHEDDALRAVRAAADMRSALAALNEELERNRGVTIGCRIGVNTGEVVAGDHTAAQVLVTGDAVNVAARLEQSAAPGQILLGETTLRQVRDAVSTEPVERLQFKGKTGRVPAFALVDVVPHATGRSPRRDAPIIGRSDELRMLSGVLGRAVRERRCVRATVVGAAGVGKSRLVEEFVAAQSDDVTVTHGRCLSYGDGITYWPVVEILNDVAGIEEGDGADMVRSKIGALLEPTGDATVVLERLAELLGLSDATASPEETHWAVRRLFEAVAARGPLTAVFEDVHWAEPALLDLIEHVTELSTDAPIVLVCTARPELEDERPGWWMTADTTRVHLFLDPLAADDADELVRHLVGSSLPEEARTIVGAAEGNPLFLEQLVGMLIDEGHLRRDGGGWTVTGDLSTLAIPTTIRGVLGARLERLPPSERDVLERGSVEGRVFHRASIAELLDPGSTGVDLVLTSLVDLGLIEPTTSLLGEGATYRFRHALIRDAAYARLSKSTRSDLHERHARWLERAAGDRVPEFEEVVAYHLEQATRLRTDLGPLDAHGRELGAEAARRLAVGGRRAAARGDMRAAANLLDRALALLDPDDPTRPELLLRLGEALMETGEGDRAMQAFEDGRATARRHGDTRIEIRAGFERTLLRYMNDPEGAGEELVRLADEGIPILEELGDDEGLARAWKGLAEEALMRADPVDLTAAYERTAGHAERAGDRPVLADALGWLSLIPWWDTTTPPEEGIRRAREIRSRLPDDRTIEALTTISEGYSLALLGRFEEARVLYRRGEDLLEELGQRIKAAALQDSAARIEMLAGDYEAAERETRKGFEALRSMGELGYLSTQAAMLGEWLYQLDRDDEAEELTRASEEAAASDDTISQVQWRGVRAKVLARRGETHAAVALAEEGEALARPTGFWDLRSESLRDLAEVYRLVGRREDAGRALREALDIIEEKGAVPLIELVGSQLAELEAAPG